MEAVIQEVFINKTVNGDKFQNSYSPGEWCFSFYNWDFSPPLAIFMASKENGAADIIPRSRRPITHTVCLS
jgi:hypothetical protein